MSADLADALDAHIGVCRLDCDADDDPRMVYLEELRRPSPRRRLYPAWYRCARNALHDLGYEYGWRTEAGEAVAPPRLCEAYPWVRQVFERGVADGRACHARYIDAFAAKALGGSASRTAGSGELTPVLQGSVYED